MTDTDIEKLVQMNQRLCFLLGGATVIITNQINKNRLDDEDLEKALNLSKEITEVIYLNKPLPQIP